MSSDASSQLHRYGGALDADQPSDSDPDHGSYVPGSDSDSDSDYQDNAGRKNKKSIKKEPGTKPGFTADFASKIPVTSKSKQKPKAKPETSNALKRKASSGLAGDCPATPKKSRVNCSGTNSLISPPYEQRETSTTAIKSAQPRKPRDPRPKLMKWSDADWKHATLAIVHACGEQGLQIPFDKAAKAINPNVTGGAFQQALLKLRGKLLAEGRDVPPMKMSWTKKNAASKGDAEMDTPAPTVVKTVYRPQPRKPTQDQAVQVAICSLKNNPTPEGKRKTIPSTVGTKPARDMSSSARNNTIGRDELDELYRDPSPPVRSRQSAAAQVGFGNYNGADPFLQSAHSEQLLSIPAIDTTTNRSGSSSQQVASSSMPSIECAQAPTGSKPLPMSSSQWMDIDNPGAEYDYSFKHVLQNSASQTASSSAVSAGYPINLPPIRNVVNGIAFGDLDQNPRESGLTFDPKNALQNPSPQDDVFQIRAPGTSPNPGARKRDIDWEDAYKKGRLPGPSSNQDLQRSPNLVQPFVRNRDMPSMEEYYPNNLGYVPPRNRAILLPDGVMTLQRLIDDGSVKWDSHSTKLPSGSDDQIMGRAGLQGVRPPPTRDGPSLLSPFSSPPRKRHQTSRQPADDAAKQTGMSAFDIGTANAYPSSVHTGVNMNQYYGQYPPTINTHANSGVWMPAAIDNDPYLAHTLRPQQQRLTPEDILEARRQLIALTPDFPGPMLNSALPPTYRSTTGDGEQSYHRGLPSPVLKTPDAPRKPALSKKPKFRREASSPIPGNQAMSATIDGARGSSILRDNKSRREASSKSRSPNPGNQTTSTTIAAARGSAMLRNNKSRREASSKSRSPNPGNLTMSTTIDGARASMFVRDNTESPTLRLQPGPVPTNNIIRRGGQSVIGRSVPSGVTAMPNTESRASGNLIDMYIRNRDLPPQSTEYPMLYPTDKQATVADVYQHQRAVNNGPVLDEYGYRLRRDEFGRPQYGLENSTINPALLTTGRGVTPGSEPAIGRVTNYCPPTVQTESIEDANPFAGYSQTEGAADANMAGGFFEDAYMAGGFEDDEVERRFQQDFEMFCNYK